MDICYGSVAATMMSVGVALYTEAVVNRSCRSLLQTATAEELTVKVPILWRSRIAHLCGLNVSDEA